MLIESKVYKQKTIKCQPLNEKNLKIYQPLLVKALFSYQDPMPTPSRETHPDHIIDNFLGQAKLGQYRDLESW